MRKLLYRLLEDVPTLTQPATIEADTLGMSRRRTQPRSRLAASTVTFNVTIDGVDLIAWHRLAKAQGITLEQLVRESVELAIARGSSR